MGPNNKATGKARPKLGFWPYLTDPIVRLDMYNFDMLWNHSRQPEGVWSEYPKLPRENTSMEYFYPIWAWVQPLLFMYAAYKIGTYFYPIDRMPGELPEGVFHERMGRFTPVPTGYGP